MMEYSERTKKEISDYFKRLVKRQPKWVKDLFDADCIWFSIDPSGQLGWEVDSSIDTESIRRINRLVMGYMHKHPAKFLIQETLH